MFKHILLVLLLNLGTNSIRENCMIEVIQRQLKYKATKYSDVSEEEVMSTFQIFSENGNLAQQELIQMLVLNFDLLEEVEYLYVILY